MSDPTYEELPYSPRVHYHTHPRVIATTARILGVEPVDPDGARVLELGCATGSNLLAMAMDLPAGHFVGIDYSAGQIERAEMARRVIGVDHVAFRCLDLSQILAEDLGDFDYLVAHGLYSWIPEGLRQDFFGICRRLLSPRGIAYVSHNTLPGWHLKRVVRDLMLFHSRHAPDAPSRVEAARSAIDWVVDGLAGQGTPHATALRIERDLLSSLDDAYVFHDYMERDNQACYLSEIVEQATENGLRFVGDAAFCRRRIDDLPREAAAFVRRHAGDFVETEQYVDFLFNESFRRSLFCFGDVMVAEALDLGRLSGLLVGLRAERVMAADEDEDVYRIGSGGRLVLRQPILRRLMRILEEVRPSLVPVDALVDRLEREAADPPKGAAARHDWCLGLFGWLLRARENGYVHLSSTPYRHAVAVARRPTASPFARWQLTLGDEVANLRQENVRLDPFVADLLGLLDGRRDHREIAEALRSRTSAIGIDVDAAVELGLAFLTRAGLLLP